MPKREPYRAVGETGFLPKTSTYGLISPRNPVSDAQKPRLMD